MPSDRSRTPGQDQSQDKDDKLAGAGGRFKYNSQNPLKIEQKDVDEKDWREVDAVLVDEASMLDLPLASALLEALPSRCQLVFVGQLPLLYSCKYSAVGESYASLCYLVCFAVPSCSDPPAAVM